MNDFYLLRPPGINIRSFSLSFIFIFLACSFEIKAQQNTEDSLQAIINNNSTDAQKTSAYKSLAIITSTKNFDESLSLSIKGAALAMKIKDTASLGEFNRLIGSVYYFKGNYDSAAVYYYHALALLNNKKYIRNKASALNDLGKLYRKTRDLDRALQSYDEAYSIYSSINDEDGMATILNESGVVFEYKADYEEAIRRYKKSLEIREKMNDILGRSYSLNFIGGVYSIQNKFTEAEKYLTESLLLRKQLKDSFSIALSYADLGSMYAKKKDFDQAMKLYGYSNNIAQGMNYPELLSENFKTLSDIAEKKGDPALSLRYFKDYNNLKESILSTAKMKQIEELNAKYQTEKKEQQLKIQEQEIQKKNFFLWGFAIIGLLVIFTAISLYSKRQVQHNLVLQQAIMKEQDIATRDIIEAEENERKRIASDLHDGIGQMMSVAKMNLSVFERELVFADEKQRISFENVIGLVDESCKEIRSLSHQMMPNALLKKGLASAVKEFIDRIDKRVINISLHTEGLNEKIDNNKETVLYRVIQECVNNVLKHAGAGQLDISLINDSDGISVTIEDDGIGFDNTGNPKSEGIGLKNITSRISYLKGSIEFDSNPGKGTLVAIHIPVS